MLSVGAILNFAPRLDQLHVDSPNVCFAPHPSIPKRCVPLRSIVLDNDSRYETSILHNTWLTLLLDYVEPGSLRNLVYRPSTLSLQYLTNIVAHYESISALEHLSLDLEGDPYQVVIALAAAATRLTHLSSVHLLGREPARTATCKLFQTTFPSSALIVR